MYEIDEVKEYLKEGERFFIDDVRYRSSDGVLLLYVPRELVADKVGKGKTSERQLKNIAKNVGEKFSTEVMVIYTLSKSHQELEAGLTEVLNLRFDNKVRTFFMSFQGDGIVESWIELSGLNEDLKNSVETFYRDTLDGTDHELGAIHWLASHDDLPTKLALLRIIKSHQPIDVASFLIRLQKEYMAVDEKWLKRALDQLRKKKLVHWQRPGEYVLTYVGLGAVPTGTRRSSSDIERALALGRKKW